jgi:uncharacterized membrane protein YedE/YeeE
MSMRVSALLLGVVFGLLLSLGGATTYDYHAQLFLFEDLRLMMIIGGAVATAGVGIWLLKKFNLRALHGAQPIEFTGKPFKPGLMLGAVLFGIGWGMSAACPGTVPAMLGEGKLAAVFTIVGILLGTWAYGLMQKK